MTSNDSTSIWLPLLRTLTQTSPDWGVLKNADRALAGIGDVDSLAPEKDWARLERCHREWSSSNGATTAIACTHTSGVLILLAIAPGEGTLLELDLISTCYFRGSILLSAEQMRPLMRQDPRGFRRLRPGAEGVILLLQNGIRRGARADVAALARLRVRDLLREDPEGVAAAARVVGAPEVLRAASAVREDEWATASVLLFEARAFGRSVFMQRGHLAKRILWRTRQQRRVCPVHRVLRDGRRVPSDLEGWLRAVEGEGPSHRVTYF
jgi:hypothetical protein